MSNLVKFEYRITEATKHMPHARLLVMVDGKTVYHGTFMSVEGCRSKLKELKIKWGVV